MRIRTTVDIAQDVDEPNFIQKLNLEDRISMELRFPMFHGLANTESELLMIKEAIIVSMNKITKKILEEIFYRKNRECKNCKNSNSDGNCVLTIEEETNCLKSNYEYFWKRK